MCLAVPGRIDSISDETPLTRRGQVDFGGVLTEINLAFVPEAGVGDYVLAHVGFAITRISAGCTSDGVQERTRSCDVSIVSGTALPATPLYSTPRGPLEYMVVSNGAIPSSALPPVRTTAVALKGRSSTSPRYRYVVTPLLVPGPSRREPMATSPTDNVVPPTPACFSAPANTSA